MNTLAKVNYIADHPLRGGYPDILHWWMATITRWSIAAVDDPKFTGQDVQDAMLIDLRKLLDAAIRVAEFESGKGWQAWSIQYPHSQYPLYCASCLKQVGSVLAGGMTAICSHCEEHQVALKGLGAKLYDARLLGLCIGKLHWLRPTFDCPPTRYLAHALTYEKYGQFEVPKGVTK